MLKLLFAALFALMPFAITGCSDSGSNNSENAITSETALSESRINGPACLIDYGFGDKYDCYEGPAAWVSQNCDMLGKVAAKHGGAVKKYDAHGCPKLSHFAGCCNDAGMVQCHYLDKLYQTQPRKNEQLAWLKRSCVESGGVWEPE